MKEILSKITGHAISDHFINTLNEVFTKYSINTNLRKAHFLAQIIHESGGLRLTEENLNYSASGLLKIFPKYFDAESAKLYARQPIKIANRVYANRMGNSNEASGDGWKFRGMGYLQNTGAESRKELSKALGIDLVINPNLLKTLPYSLLSAGVFWSKRNINVLADKDDCKAITKAINGGFTGFVERVNILNELKAVL